MLDPENLKNKKISTKTEVKVHFRLLSHCVDTQWDRFGRQAEMVIYTCLGRFLIFFSLATNQISYLLAKLIMLDPEN